MNKKGFTLIELLAVIVVLAIIALVSVPIVDSLITSSTEGTAIISANGLIESAEVLYSNRMLDNSGYLGETVYFSNGAFSSNLNTDRLLEHAGKLPVSGNMVIASSGIITLNDLYFEDNELYCNGIKGSVSCTPTAIH